MSGAGETRTMVSLHANWPCPTGTVLRLGDRHLLLHAEQGFGDTLQFVRFGSLIPKAGGNITLAVQAELVSLLAGMPWADEVISLDEGLPSADVHAPLANLPSLLDPTGHLVRSIGAYLSLPDPSLQFPRKHI